MERSLTSASVEKCDVIVLSDDSDTSLSNHVDDADDTSPPNRPDDVDGERELASDEVPNDGNELVKKEDQDGSDETTHGENQNGDTESPHDTDRKEQDGGNDAGDGTQYGAGETQCEDDGRVTGKDENGVECKPTTDHSALSPASDDVLKPAVDVSLQQDVVNPPHPAPCHAAVNEFQPTVVPTTTYCRRPSRARRSWSGRAPDPADPDQVVSAARGGRGRGRRRNRVLGPRGVAPLSLRQFFDSGGRDYVEYLMRHIQAGVGLSFC